MEKISIIIPCKEIDLMTSKCVLECLKLDYDNFEVIVLPDSEPEFGIKSKKVITIKTGKVFPALKRNIGMSKAKGRLYAFIDSDAYPRRDWLKNALAYFSDEKVGIVGGPNLTPSNANFWEKVSGHVLANFWASGFASIRYKIAKKRFVKELPSSNYISRRETAEKYDSNFLTAEDSKFCFNAIKKGFKVLYADNVVVYHHRRDSFLGHLKQMWTYGRDIAQLTKKEFSIDKIYYAANSIGLLVFVLGVILSISSPQINTIFSYVVFFYLLISFVTSIKESLEMTFAVFATTIATHFTYGFGWLYGIFSRKK